MADTDELGLLHEQVLNLAAEVPEPYTRVQTSTEAVALLREYIGDLKKKVAAADRLL